MFAKRGLLKTLVIFLFLGLVACSDDDSKSGENGNNGSPTETCEAGTDARAQVAKSVVGQNQGVNDGDVVIEESGDPSVYTATIDVSAGGAQEAKTHSYIYLDLESAEKLDISDEDAFENTDWDIALRREEIRVNSGDSGPGQWLVTQVDAKWDEITPPGRDDNLEWLKDDFISEDCEIQTEGRSGLTTAFGIYYDYDPTTHQVTIPETRNWVLYNPTNHAVYKFGVESFDSTNYTVKIRWASLT